MSTKLTVVITSQYTYIKSLRYTPKTNKMLNVNYISIKKKELMGEREDKL